MANRYGSPRRQHSLLRHCLAVVVCIPLLPLRSAAQEDTSTPSAQRVELPGGIKLELPEGLAKEQAAAILETYARRLRRMAPSEVKTGPTMPRLLVTRDVGVEVAPPTEIPPLAAAPTADPPTPIQTAEVEHSTVFDSSAARSVTLLPATLLWQPPLANQHEPRMSVKLTSLDTEDFKHVSDFSIGGTMALVRNAPADRAEDGVQLDLFAVAISRFVATRDMTALDYRFGVPLTFARGPWSAKLSYEHTSTHLGDEFLNSHPGSHNRSSDREELSLGLAYRALEALRFYGVLTYAFHMGTFVEDASPYRYDLGVEWSRPAPTGWRGQPFAALDLEIRGDEDFTPNFTAQAGWQWIAEAARPGLRVAAEYYDGRSPFGQFIDRHESWVGVCLFFDY